MAEEKESCPVLFGDVDLFSNVLCPLFGQLFEYILLHLFLFNFTVRCVLWLEIFSHSNATQKDSNLMANRFQTGGKTINNWLFFSHFHHFHWKKVTNWNNFKENYINNELVVMKIKVQSGRKSMTRPTATNRQLLLQINCRVQEYRRIFSRLKVF